MRKGTETVCGNVKLGALNLSLKNFLKWKYYGAFTYISTYFNSNPDENLIKGLFATDLI